MASAGAITVEIKPKLLGRIVLEAGRFCLRTGLETQGLWLLQRLYGPWWYKCFRVCLIK